MKKNVSDVHASIDSPPGGLMIWFFIFSELFVFGCALASFIYQRNFELDMFREARLQLNQTLATINTLVLITSGFFVARSAKNYENKQKRKTVLNISLAMILGLVFLVLKGVEYNQKIGLGLTMGTNTFFDYYWVLTAFHAMHVLLGIIILAVIALKVHFDSPFEEKDFNLHTGASYWHMCDLIWILVFTVIYLL